MDYEAEENKNATVYDYDELLTRIGGFGKRLNFNPHRQVLVHRHLYDNHFFYIRRLFSLLYSFFDINARLLV